MDPSFYNLVSEMKDEWKLQLQIECYFKDTKDGRRNDQEKKMKAISSYLKSVWRWKKNLRTMFEPFLNQVRVSGGFPAHLQLSVTSESTSTVFGCGSTNRNGPTRRRRTARREKVLEDKGCQLFYSYSLYLMLFFMVISVSGVSVIFFMVIKLTPDITSSVWV